MSTENLKNEPVGKELTKEEIKRAAAIMAALDVGQAFKLYSYRIISPEDFTEKLYLTAKELVKTLK